MEIFTSHTPDWKEILTYQIEFDNDTYLSPQPYAFVNKFRKADTTKSVLKVCVSPEEDYMVLVISENRFVFRNGDTHLLFE